MGEVIAKTEQAEVRLAGGVTPRRRGPGTAHHLLLWSCTIAGAVFASLAVGEIFCRSALDTRYHVWPPGLQYVFRPSPEIMPGIEGQSRFVINRDGMRGDPLPTDASYKILAVGGSTTECLYLDDGEAWPYLLQRSFGADRPVWVGNVGKSGLKTKHHIAQLEHLTRQYPNIDAIILLIGVNDLMQRLAREEETSEYYPFPGIQSLPLRDYEILMSEAFSVWPGSDGRVPLYKRSAMWRVGRELRHKYFMGRAGELNQNEDGSVYARWRANRRSAVTMRTALPNLLSALNEYARNIETMVHIATTRGMRVILATQPYLWRADLRPEESHLLWLGGVGKYQEEPGHEYYSPAALARGMDLYNQQLLRLCLQYSLECIDLDKEISKDASQFYDDVHFTEAGARHVAQVFFRSLISKTSLRRQI